MNLHRSRTPLFTLLLTLLSGCAERTDTFEEYLEVAWHHERAAETQPAIAAYRKALQLDPAQPVAWYDLGVLLQSAGQNEQAAAAWTEALKYDPAYVQALVNRGGVHAQLGRNADALADYSAAIKAAPEDFTARRNRAALHEELQNLTDALADLSEALRINPRDAETWLDRGRLRLKLNDWNRALVDFEQAAELSPDSAPAWLGLAQTLAELGQSADASIAFGRAQQIDPELKEKTLDSLPKSTPSKSGFVSQIHAEAVEFVRNHLNNNGISAVSAQAPWDLRTTGDAPEQKYLVRILKPGTDLPMVQFTAAEVDALNSTEQTTTLVLVRSAPTTETLGAKAAFQLVISLDRWKPDPAALQPAAWTLPVAVNPADAAAKPVAAASR
jgi:tetratricopeptide (TPR) repeat protein